MRLWSKIKVSVSTYYFKSYFNLHSLTAEVNLKEMEMIKLEADRKNMEINKHEDEMKQMAEKFEQYKIKIQPLREQLKRDIEIRERLSSITAIKTKAETE